MKIRIGAVLSVCLLLAGVAEAGEQTIHKLDDVMVSEQRQEITYTPEMTAVDVESHQHIGIPQHIGDVIENQPVIDFRGASDLVPGDLVDGDDTIHMRGFGSNRFVTAMDGSNLHKPGGRQSFHVVDYSLLPTFLIEKVEILPGPHSALYPGQGIGGVINLVTRTPERYDTRKPSVTISTGYKS